MSVHYTAVGWNPFKKTYDRVMAAGMALYLILFAGLGAVIHPAATVETLLIRALGTLALLLLHVVLCIGPLCRLDSRFLPLLYNRRHLGVATFVAGLAHGAFALVQFHALGDVNPVVSLLSSNTQFRSVSQFPFELLGAAALAILFLMAATSHDFWLHNLKPAAWKKLHMMVYLAYALLVAHVALGALQSETSPWLAGVLAAGVLTISALHLAAAARERPWRDGPSQQGFVDVCDFESIPDGRGRAFSLNGERIAVFRLDNRVSALSNVCRHQNGPLGEGKIVNGCVTCPWHGYQYDPETGAAPPPFDDRVPTFEARVVDGRVQVNPCPR